MALSQGGAGSYVPGLTLKAWAMVAADGTIVKSSNVASVVKAGTGIYDITFTVPMASINWIFKVTAASGFPVSCSLNTKTVSGARMFSLVSYSGSAQDATALWEFYE